MGDTIMDNETALVECGPFVDERREAALAGIRAILEICGEDPTRDGLIKTPERVIKAFWEQAAGYDMDPKKILSTNFDEKFDEMIVLKDIEFSSLCEHHLLPFLGTVTIGYIPNGGVVGISKLARLVDCFARRFQVQERLTNQIAEAIEVHLHALGVGVIVSAQHQCMKCRGVGKQQSTMVTSIVRGIIKTDERARAEFLSFK